MAIEHLLPSPVKVVANGRCWLWDERGKKPIPLRLSFRLMESPPTDVKLFQKQKTLPSALTTVSRLFHPHYILQIIPGDLVVPRPLVSFPSGCMTWHELLPAFIFIDIAYVGIYFKPRQPKEGPRWPGWETLDKEKTTSQNVKLFHKRNWRVKSKKLMW